MRRIISLVLTVVLCLSVLAITTGCSEKSVDIAFITSRSEGKAYAAESCFEGVVSFSDMNNKTYRKYIGACDEQIEAAVKDNANVVVLAGVDDKNEVYSLAGKYPHVKFVCADFGNDFLVRPNVVCFNVNRTQCAVYAGYSAVKEGNLTIGIQGDKSAETASYIRGIVEGAQIAAVEIGVKKNPVKIYYSVSSSDMLSERTKSWTENGCDFIICTESTYEITAEAAAASEKCKIISLGAEKTGNKNVTVGSAYGDYSKAVFTLLKTAFNNNFEGGTMLSAGADNGFIKFTYEASEFEKMTAEDIEALTNVISAFGLTDLADYKTPSDKGYSKIKLSEVGIIINKE